jgi:hypothetical protein
MITPNYDRTEESMDSPTTKTKDKKGPQRPHRTASGRPVQEQGRLNENLYDQSKPPAKRFFESLPTHGTETEV